MPPEIVAHRGVHHAAPENSLLAFESAFALGADAVEFDVRLSSDGIPVVYHYFYLTGYTTLEGTVFNHTWQELRGARLTDPLTRQPGSECIPSLAEVLEALAGRIGLEIEIKGPEPESVAAIAGQLQRFKAEWDSMEVTSYEPALLAEVRRRCPGLAADLLIPRPESWMKADVTAYTAIQRARLAGARAVHLHPTQLDAFVTGEVRAGGLEIHAWDVNSLQALEHVLALGIPRLDTDNPQLALTYRQEMIL